MDTQIEVARRVFSIYRNVLVQNGLDLKGREDGCLAITPHHAPEHYHATNEDHIKSLIVREKRNA